MLYTRRVADAGGFAGPIIVRVKCVLHLRFSFSTHIYGVSARERLRNSVPTDIAQQLLSRRKV